jgi:hypothetical protein
MNKWGQKAGGDSTNKYQKRRKRGQQGGFGIIEERDTEQPMGGVENMEIDKETGKEAVEKVEEINESGGETITTVQEEEILTQQSAAALNTEEGGAVEEQLLDYDEDPLVAEKLVMVELEKKWSCGQISWSKNLPLLYRVRKECQRRKLEIAAKTHQKRRR